MKVDSVVMVSIVRILMSVLKKLMSVLTMLIVPILRVVTTVHVSMVILVMDSNARI